VADEDAAGYKVYRDGRLIASLDLTATGYHDAGLEEGEYAYTVKAFDFAQWESAPSNEVVFRVDLVGPTVNLAVPQDGAVLNDLVEIKGTAFSEDDFRQYRVYLGTGPEPADWTLIRTSPVPVSYGVLAVLSDPLSGGGDYCVKLEAEDLSGNISDCCSCFTIDDVSLGAPNLLSATVNVSDVNLTWELNNGGDLAGYLLYRNGYLVNSDGPVVGSLKPYLVPGPTYNDPALPDGTYEYYLEAMDQAGNISPPSNEISVTIDVRAPRAIIASPADGHKFQHPVTVKAVCEDLDVAEIQIQYRPEGASWTNLGSLFASPPYATNLDPVAEGMSYGIYGIRAVAKDKTGNVDADPAFITVEHTDVTPPAVPSRFAARVTGGDITLTWDANTEDDLAGYNIYRLYKEPWSDEIFWEPLNQELITETTVTVFDYVDGEYTFVIQAVDTYDNKSAFSDSIYALVYAPLVAQPFTPVGEDSITITGGNVVPSSTVSVFVDSQPVVHVSADVSGAFSVDIALNQGENIIAVSAADAAGNISKQSEVIVVYNLPPSAPVNPAVSVSGYDCLLTWDANSEGDITGYNIFRGGEQLNAPQQADLAGAVASASSNGHYAGRAIDNNDLSVWEGYIYLDDPDHELWWQLDLPSEMLITEVTIDWAVLEEAGREFEFQVWTGHAWLTYAGFTENESLTNIISFDRPYPTSRMRLVISMTNGVPDEYNEIRVSLAEFSVTRARPVPDISFSDQGLGDGSYVYQVTAVDQYGFESPLSDSVTALVGDNEPDVSLSWLENEELDLAGYNVYRKSGDEWRLMTPVLLTVTEIVDTVLADGTYTYRVTAVDLAGNESLPSEVEAVVSTAGVERLRIISVISSPQGGAVKVCWEDPADISSGYNLYRGEAPGGPYVRVNDSPLTDTCYFDEGLVNGVTYYYTVAAVDELGGEGEPADEVAILPEDMIPLSRPVILEPTVSGQPVTVADWFVDVAGTADPGSSVELYRNGAYMGSVLAGDQSASREFPLALDDGDLVSPVSVSPDNRTAAYFYIKGGYGPLVMGESSGGQDDPGIHLALMDIESGGVEPVAAINDDTEIGNFVWSPDGSRILYSMYCYRTDSGGFYIYNRLDDSLISLLDDNSGFFPYWCSWSFDGEKVIFVTRSFEDDTTSIWMKDLLTGDITSLKQTTSPDDRIYFASMSSDNRYLVYLYSIEDNEPELVVMDIAGGDEVFRTANIAECYSEESFPRWSPGANRVLYPSWYSGEMALSVYDADKDYDFVTTGIIHFGEFLFDWYGDGDQIVYLTYDMDEGKVVLRSVPTGFPQQSRSVAVPENGEIYCLQAAGGNGTWLLEAPWSAEPLLMEAGSEEGEAGDAQYILRRLYFGSFAFDQVGLEPGDNIFQALSVSDAGETSPWSDFITVILDPDMLPDIKVSAEDFFVYPPAPAQGETVIGSVYVVNPGQVDVADVRVDIDVMDAGGGYESVHTEYIDLLPASSSQSVDFSWDSSGRAGEYTFRAGADPRNDIQETCESNNVAKKRIYVTAGHGLAMDTRLDADQYIRGDQVEITVDVVNSGPEADALLEVWVTDAFGDTVSELAAETLALEYGDMKQACYELATVDIYEGDYTAHSCLSKAGDVLVSAAIPFIINPDLDLAVTLTADGYAYGADQEVNFDFRITNNGASDFNAPQCCLTVSDEGGHELFTQELGYLEILAGAFTTRNALWNTGLNPPGVYHAAVRVYAATGDLMADAETMFEITAEAGFTGTLKIAPVYVLPGNAVNADYTLINNGNSPAIDVPVDIVLLHPATGATIDSFQETVNIPASGSVVGAVTFATGALELATYTVSLRADGSGGIRTLASGTFIVADAAPPELVIVSPEEGGTYHDDFYLIVNVSDNLSAVESVSYSLDNGDWRPLPCADPATGRYSVRFSPEAADEGTRVFRFQATDTSHNTPEEPAAVTVHIVPRVTVDLALDAESYDTDAPVQALVTLINTGWEKQVTVVSVIETEAGAPVATLDPIETLLESGATATLDVLWNTGANPAGAYRFRSSVLAGGQVISADDVAFSIREMTDIAPPRVTILSPLSGDVFNAPFMIEAEAIDEGSGVDLVEYQFDLGDWRLLPLIQDNRYGTEYAPVEADAGPHIVSFRATDRAGNVSEAQSVDISIEFYQAYFDLTGELTLSPLRVMQEMVEHFCYVITNPADQGVENLTIRAEVKDPVSGLVLAILEDKANVEAGGVVAADLEWTADVPASIYTVVLSIALDAPVEPRILDDAELEVIERPDITVDQWIDRQSVNLLVWLNDNCRMACPEKYGWQWWHAGYGECHWDGCIREDLLKAVLDQAVADYRIVTDKQEFAAEIRNPCYTDVLVLGDHQTLGCKTTAELMERVNGGLGIVSAKWFQHTLEANLPFAITSIFGVSILGQLYCHDYTVTTVTSPISGEDTITPKGKACRVSADSDATIAGWIESDQRCFCSGKSPAIVLSQYGRARTVYFAFDLGLTLESDYDGVASLLANAVQYVHGNRDTIFPWDMVRVTSRIDTTADDFILTVSQTYDEALRLYDPVARSWIMENPWQFEVDLEAGLTKEFSSYYLAPDAAGIFNVDTEIGLILDDENISLESRRTELNVDTDRVGLYDHAIGDIEYLNVSGWHRFTVCAIVKRLKAARDRSINKYLDIERNIFDVIGATHSLMLLWNVDTADVRQQLDTLLKLEQGRYYSYQQ